MTGNKISCSIHFVMTNHETKKGTMAMIHLTLTGFHAGSPLCGVDKTEAKERGERFIHGMYFPFSNAEMVADLCTKCKQIWDNEGSDSDGE